MAVPTLITDLSTTAASNSPAGSDNVFPDLDNFIRAYGAFIAQLNSLKAPLASPTFTGPVTTGGAINMTGASVINNSSSYLAVQSSGELVLDSANAGGDISFRINGVQKATLNSAGVMTFSVAPQSSVAAAAANDLVRKAEFDAAAVSNATTSTAGKVQLATNAVAITGTDSNQAVTPAAMHAANIVTAAPIATTSGTSIDLSTAIPSWAKRVTLSFNGVSTSGSSGIRIQVGSGSYATSGYNSSSNGVNQSSGTSGQNDTSGFAVFHNLASNAVYGSMTIIQDSANTVSQSHSGVANVGTAILGGGAVSLAGVMDRVRISTTNGTDTFDSGSVSIFWE